MKEIKIEDFITIKILELDSEGFVYFVDYYNEKYFYVTDDNELYTHKSINICYNCYDLYFKKAKFIHHNNLDNLKKYVYKLYRQLTFSIPRATKEQDYYFISSTFKVERVTDYNGIRSNSHYNLYNYFLSEEEATKCAEILQETLVKLRKEEAMKKENK